MTQSVKSAFTRNDFRVCSNLTPRPPSLRGKGECFFLISEAWCSPFGQVSPINSWPSLSPGEEHISLFFETSPPSPLRGGAGGGVPLKIPQNAERDRLEPIPFGLEDGSLIGAYLSSIAFRTS